MAVVLPFSSRPTTRPATGPAQVIEMWCEDCGARPCICAQWHECAGCTRLYLAGDVEAEPDRWICPACEAEYERWLDPWADPRCP